MNKLYVLVRGDLTKSQQAVQACHAVAEFMLWGNYMPCMGCSPRCQDKYWNNGTIVLLKMKNREELSAWTRKVSELKYPHDEFFEPDIQDYTATAVYDLDGKLQELLKDIPLL